jgi:DNA segregation ATPase FtsK/SpoIIIE-like protein
MDGGTGAGLAALGVLGLAFLRVIYRMDRFERSVARRRQQRAPVQVPVSQPAAPAHPMVLPGGWPEDLKVLFSRSVRLAVEKGFVTPLMLQRRLGVDVTNAMRLLWALESTGAVGGRQGPGNQAQAVVRADQLPEFFAYWGIVEDAPPPQDAAPQ